MTILENAKPIQANINSDPELFILKDPSEIDYGILKAPDLINNNNAINVINNTNNTTNNGNDDNSNNVNIDIDPDDLNDFDDPNDPDDLDNDDPGMDIDDPAESINLMDQLAAGDLTFITMPDPVSFEEAISRDDWQ